MAVPGRAILLTLLAISVGLTRADDPPVADEPFVQYARDPFITGAGGENDIRKVLVDADGTPWLATQAGVRKVVDGRMVPVGADVIRGPAYTLALGSKGEVWVGAWNGVYRVAGSAELVRSAPGPVLAILVDGARVVVGDAAGVQELTPEGWRPYAPSSPRGVRSLAWKNVSNGGKQLRAATDVGLFFAEDHPKTGERRWARQTITGNEHASVRTVVAGPPSRAGSAPFDVIWATNVGALAIGAQSEALPWYIRTELRPRPPVGAINDLVWSDEPGRKTLWGATPRGLLRWTYPSDKSDPKSAGIECGYFRSKRWLVNDDVRSLALGPDGALYVGTAEGLTVLRGKEMTLVDKAAYYEAMIRARHVRPPGLVERCLLRVPGDLSTYEPMDTDNDGEYTGTYLVAEAYRYAATKDPVAKKNAESAYRALEFLQTVTGTSGFIARTVVPADWTRIADPNRTYSPHERTEMLAENPREKFVERRWRLSGDLEWLWKGDTSSDEITGHLYSYAVYHDLVAEGAEKKRVADLTSRVVDFIIDGGYVLRDEDGQATLWGVWSPDKLNRDPNWINERGVNSVEILSYLTTARHMTGDEKYEREIERLLVEEDYAKNILSPRPYDPAAYTYIDDELIVMAYHALLTYETNPYRKELYRKSLDAWFRTVRADASPCYNFMYAYMSGAQPVEYLRDPAVRLLRDVPLDMIHWSIDNTDREDIELVNIPQAETVQTRPLLPPSEIPVMRWDNNPHRARGGEGGHAEMCPAFWLWGYWIGRYHGMIGPEAP